MTAAVSPGSPGSLAMVARGMVPCVAITHHPSGLAVITYDDLS